MNRDFSFEILAVDVPIAPALLRGCAELFCQIWKEPPWNEDHWKVSSVEAEILKVVFRPGSVIRLMTITTPADPLPKVAGFTWAFPVSVSGLAKIAGHKQLNPVFEPGRRVYYLAELGVEKSRREEYGLGKLLSTCLLADIQAMGPVVVVLRTDVEALVARSLYSKLGFKELSVCDKNHPTRTYWTLNL